MNPDAIPTVKITPPAEKKRWPVAITAAFVVVTIASFLPWGTIRYHYSWQFMAYMSHPGLTNRIITHEDHSGLKQGANLNQTGSAWKAGLIIMGLYVPHWLLAVLATLLFVCAGLNFLGYLSINPSIPQLLSFCGLLYVIASALGFFSQGSIGWGLILTGIGYLVFTVSFLRWK